MKIRMSSNVLIVVYLWGLVCILNVSIIFILRTDKSFLMILAPILAISAILSIFNIINLVVVYKDFLTVTDDSIIINNGLIYKKKSFNLSDVKSVKHTKTNMLFYMTNGKNKLISLTFISKGDEIALYEFLISKSININT